MTLGTNGLKLAVLVGALALSATSVGLPASPAHAGVRIGLGVPVAPAPALVAPPPVVYPAPVYGGVRLGSGWHADGWHHDGWHHDGWHHDGWHHDGHGWHR
jgi:hypothetical protein